jgi:hypothetical protein
MLVVVASAVALVVLDVAVAVAVAVIVEVAAKCLIALIHLSAQKGVGFICV